MSVREEIDAALSAWCADKDAFAAARSLRDAGVPAYAVLRPSDLYCDQQLMHREFFVTLEHTVMGPTPYDGLATKFSATPGKLWKAGPCLGEDTVFVLEEILGLSSDEIARYAECGALQ
jgi:formyl-CoA transferase